MNDLDDNGTLEGLNPSQLEAVTTTEGYVRVIAGAGSGKTRALSRRFAYLVNDLGIMPGNILCVTFTNKAANEMRLRIRKLTGDADTGYVNTFHGFCVSVLQEDSSAVALPKSFLVLDNSDIDAMLQIIYDERGLTLRDYTFSRARDMFEIRKTFTHKNYHLELTGLSLDDLKLKYDLAESPDDILFYGYLYQQKKCFGLDYNDLIILTLDIFRRREDLRLKWQKRLQYLMVDEFQDIDGLQHELMEVLAAHHRNLFVVGDPDQTIYTWRGANVKYLLSFDEHFPGTQTVMMNENYRSTPQITMTANSLISANRNRLPKSLISMVPPGPKTRCYHGTSSANEAAWIVDQIQQLASSGVPLRDICIVYRAHYASRPIEDAFVKEGLPYTIYSGVQFFDRKEVKDALSYLRMVVFRDDLSFERIANVPKRNLGTRRMKFLRQYAEGNGVSLYQALVDNLDNALMKGTKAHAFVDLVERYAPEAETRPASELLAELMDKSGYELALRTEGSQERLDNLAELRQAVYEWETSCGEEASTAGFLMHASMMTNLDKGLSANKVKLMTIHAAKGLEFPYVFICSMNEGVIPSRKTRTTEAMEEERRLAFVAITRAQKGLYLTCADGTAHDGMPRYPSRFVLDIDPDLIDYETPLEDSLVKDAQAYIRTQDRQLDQHEASPPLQPGTRVSHIVFGVGTIVSFDAERGSYEIQFENMNTTRSLSMRANLEVLP
ncbi:MAG: UvrD-helicase domain-containing protein [Eggerthellaceae bacterium]|nr:UvrD-helicase domain-containing protein [Eggerthellaceae bacterium]